MIKELKVVMNKHKKIVEQNNEKNQATSTEFNRESLRKNQYDIKLEMKNSNQTKENTETNAGVDRGERKH